MSKYAIVSVMMVAILALSVIATAQGALDWDNTSQTFDRDVYQATGGPSGEHFVVNSPEYDKLQAAVKKIGTSVEFNLVDDDSVTNLGSSVNAAYITSGLVKNTTDAELWYACLSLEGYIVSNVIKARWDAAWEMAGKTAAIRTALLDAAQTLNKSGTSENAKMVRDWSKLAVGGSLPIFHYDQDCVLIADKWAVSSMTRLGVKPEEYVGFFDKKVGGGIIGQSPLGQMYDYPSVSKRKDNAQKAYADALKRKKETDDLYAKIGDNSPPEQLEKTKPKEVEEGPWEQIVRGKKFDGYAYKQLDKAGNVYALVKGFSGELPSRKGTITLPKGARVLEAVMVNPRPENFMAVGLWSEPMEMFGIMADKEPAHADCIAMCLPVIMITLNPYELVVTYGDGPGAASKLTPLRVPLKFKMAD